MALSLTGLFVAAGGAAQQAMTAKRVAADKSLDAWSKAMDEFDACKCANKKHCQHALVVRRLSANVEEKNAEAHDARVAYAKWYAAR